jgi:hypothetical protein
MTISRRRAQRLVFAVWALHGLASPPAAAQESANDAEALFQRARERMGQGDFASACPMLERAYALDHGAGTQLALAICHEGEGKPALALREFRESLSIAVRANRSDRVMLAEAHVQALEASVPRIKIRPPSPAPSGLELTIDGETVDPAAAIAGIPVDPGAHVVGAVAPPASPWQTRIDVGKSSAPVVVDVPAPVLTSAPVASPDRAGTAPSPSRAAGWITGAFGAAAAAAGAGFGIAAFDAEARSRRACTSDVCTPAGVDLNHQARRDALVSDVSFVVAGAALAVSAYLLLRGRPTTSALLPVHRQSHPAFEFEVGAAAGAAHLGVAGAW